MPLNIYDLPTLLAQLRGYFRAQFPNADQGSESYHGQLAAVIAMALLEAQHELLQVDQDWPPTGSSYTPGRQSSRAALDQAAVLLGLPNGVGGLGRLLATVSSGGQGTLFAPATTNYSNGLLLKDQTGAVQVTLSGAVTIPAMASSALGFFVSLTTGAAANLPAGATLSFQTPPSGAQGTVVLTSPLTGGTEEETDAALLARIYDRLGNPRTGGRSADIVQWLSVVKAIKNIWVFGKRGGTGMVDVVIGVGGRGTARTPSNQTLAEAVAAYALNRPNCSQFNVLPPYFPAARGLTIRSLAIPSLSKYRWDWVSGTGSVGYQITKSFVPGDVGVIVAGDISATSPSLKAAIDRGAKPRVQVAPTGGPPIPTVVPVIAYEILPGPNTALLFGTVASPWQPPADWVPFVSGDRIYPAGPLSVNQLDPTVSPVHKSAAQLVLEYVDALGPSRQSGYADEAYYWDDTLRIDDIKSVIIGSTLDLDGTPMVRTTGNSPLSDTTIQIGSGMPAALDFVTLDATPGQPPELARAVRVIVTGP